MYRTDKKLDEVTDDTHFEGVERDSNGWNLIRRITVGKNAEDLYDFYRDMANQPAIHAHFAEVTPLDQHRTHWKVALPLGQSLEWDSEIVEEVRGQVIGWRSLEGASVPNEGSVSFQPAPANWGTEVTLWVRFNPPLGILGDAAMSMSTAAPKIVADKMLRRFKSLIETGEIPTIDGQPAARKDGRDEVKGG